VLGLSTIPVLVIRVAAPVAVIGAPLVIIVPALVAMLGTTIVAVRSDNTSGNGKKTRE
jgi:hypothetical protein